MIIHNSSVANASPPRSISAPGRYAPYGRTPKGFVPNRGGLVAGPSRLHGQTASKSPRITERERRLLDLLRDGGGIEQWEQDRFFETCDGCGHLFLTGALTAHILKCDCKGKGKATIEMHR
jgi:hypothetical protein